MDILLSKGDVANAKAEVRWWKGKKSKLYRKYGIIEKP